MEPLERTDADGRTELVVPSRALGGLWFGVALWGLGALALWLVRHDTPARIPSAVAVAVALAAAGGAVWTGALLVRGLLGRLVIVALDDRGVAPEGSGTVPWKAVQRVEIRDEGAGARSVVLRIRRADVPDDVLAALPRGPRRSLEGQGLIRLRGAGDPTPVADRIRAARRAALGGTG